MSFRILGLDPTPFRPLFGLDQTVLAARGIQRFKVDHKPGFPDRIEVRDLEIGETALLLNFTHQPADTPYRSSHAIFIGESSGSRFDAVDVVPDVLRVRPISLRGFDERGEMHDADLVDGRELTGAIERMFGDSRIAYLHAHYAKRGCYAARVERA